jgi:TonB family protein
MTQLQKKCFVASSGVHGLLLAVAVVLAVFHSEPAVTEEQVLTLISPRILDRDGSGGEAPAPVAPQPIAAQQQPAAPPPAAPPNRPPAPEPAPQPRATEPVKSVALTEPKPKVEKTTTERPSTSAKTATSKTHEVVPDLSRPTRISQATKPSNSTVTAERSATDARSAEVAQTLANWGSNIRKSGASATVVTVPGEGGGEAFTGYDTAVKSIYDQAWKSPDTTAQNLPPAEVKIVVARDGTIISAELIGTSGDATVDRSVERALNSVSKLPAFPQGAQDAQRTFRFRFNLKDRQSSG